MPARAPAASLTALALSVAACGGAQDAGEKGAVSAAAALERVKEARDIDGRRVGPASAEERATLVIVFASWCGPCRNELAKLGEIAASETELRILGLNAYEEWNNHSDEERLRAFLAANAPWLRVVRADDQLLSAFGGVPKVPSLFIYDGAGRLVREFRRHHRRPPSRTELEAAIAAAKR